MKLLKLLVPLVALLAIATCSGPAGESYLAYSWVSDPLYLYDQNPSAPAVVANGSYFHSAAGDYYMEYTAWDSSNWWMYYSISDEPGKPILEKGADGYFEITLYSSGPAIWKWTSPRTLQEAGAGSDSTSATLIHSETPLAMKKGPVAGRDSCSSNGGTG